MSELKRSVRKAKIPVYQNMSRLLRRILCFFVGHFGRWPENNQSDFLPAHLLKTRIKEAAPRFVSLIVTGRKVFQAWLIAVLGASVESTDT